MEHLTVHCSHIVRGLGKDADAEHHMGGGTVEGRMTEDVEGNDGQICRNRV